MTVNAKLRFARITPRKARLVTRTIAGLPVEVAQTRLKLLAPRAAPMILKLLNSAVANARQNFSLDPKTLFVSRVLVNEGPRLKRFVPRARGSADRLLKRTSHIEVILEDRAGGEGKAITAVGKKTDILTKKAEALEPWELRGTAEGGDRKKKAPDAGAVKPVEAPRGIRRLLERKHGET